MTLSRHSSRVYMDEYDLDGVLNALAQRIDLAEGGPQFYEDNRHYYMGAHIALNIIRNHDYIDTQREFMELFDGVLDKRWNID